jgi:hypothetical protein
MIAAFAAALSDALDTFKTDVTAALTANLPVTIGIGLSVIGIGVVWGLVRRFAKAR